MESTLYNGDYIVVRENATYDDQDIVVAGTEAISINENYIVKRYYSEYSKEGLFLIGDNPECSYDSRNFGEIPQYSYRGKAVIRISKTDGIDLL